MADEDAKAALKKQAAVTAVERVRSGMVLGLGTGSTTAFAVERIGEMWQAGELEDVVGIPTSERTAEQARSYGLPLGDLKDHPRVDLAIDGADEVDPNLDLIKGLGGALLREKRVERAADTFVVVIDDGKLVDKLGTKGPLPVEVGRDAWQGEAAWLATLGCDPVLRGGAADPFVSDNGNYIVDCRFAAGIEDAHALAASLDERPGVMAHGLFLDMANAVIVARADGIQVLARQPRL
ncbi:MAG: ribose 5-phosphate isomerase A [Myxococcota bacterium]